MTEQSINLPLNSIQADTRAQSRAEIDIVVVGEYADDMKAGAVFPPMVVFYDQATYWLAEGFHRYHAYKQAEITAVPAIVKTGGLREAILQSLGSNADHGKRRSNADKRRAVEMMLKDAEWNRWSDREIARQCAVDNKFVGNMRRDLSVDYPQIEKTATRNGTTYTINTGNIGKKADPVAPAVVETLPLPVVAPPVVVMPEDEEPPFEIEHEDENGEPVSFQPSEPDDEEAAFLAELEAEAAATPASAFDKVVPEPVVVALVSSLVEPDTSEEELIDQAHQTFQWLNKLDEEDDVAVVAPTIPVAPPAVSKADPRQLGYIGASPVAERDSNDWHTPAKYIAAVKDVMLRIGLDPFSSAKANETVGAERFFTIEDDALGDIHWYAETLFMNPPYSRGVIDAAVDRFLSEWRQCNFKEAIVLVNNATETQWFQSLMMECSAICFTDHRIAFNSPDNKQESGNTRGQAFFLFGHRFGPFSDAFHQFGAIVQVMG